MRTIILTFLIVLSLQSYSQSSVSLTPFSKETKTYIDETWKMQDHSDTYILLEPSNDWKSLQISITESAHKMIYNLKASVAATKWLTDEGYEYLIRYFRGTDDLGKIWNVEFYIPRSTNAPFVGIVLKNDKLLIRYKITK